MEQNWKISPIIPPEISTKLSAFPPIMRQLLFNRGLTTDDAARKFLRAQVDFDTSPGLLMGMNRLVERVFLAKQNKEKVAIYGDYDVDGVTSTTLLVEALGLLGLDVREYIPNRFEEGYGLNNEALTYLKVEGISLVISVDCGIRSIAEAEHATKIGLDLIITDHHDPGDVIPVAYAVINPKQSGDLYPEKSLAGVGIAYKVAVALAEQSVKQEGVLPYDPTEFLDLVALGTVADVAPLRGENRQLVRRGLRRLRVTQRQGIAALAAVADVKLSKATATSIGFSLAPRLNAAGRLESALLSFYLLSTKDIALAGELAQKLNVRNNERQKITRDIQEKALELATQQQSNPNLLFAVSTEFNHGIVGLAASKLCETFYRPAIVGAYDEKEGTTRCSCRSIPEYHLSNALDRMSHFFIKYGGHAAAAGFTIANDKLEDFKACINADVAERLPEDLARTVRVDLEVELSDLTLETVEHLEYFQPTGQENPDAVFVSRNVEVRGKRTVGADGKHLKLTLSSGRGPVDAIGFNFGHLASSLPKRIDILYALEINEYNGVSNLQLKLKDIKF